MRNLKVSLATIKPYWSDGVYVPSLNIIDQIEQSFDENVYNLNVDWIDSDNVRVVFPYQIDRPTGLPPPHESVPYLIPEDYMLMKIEISDGDKKEDYYFKFDHVEKTLSNGKVCIYTLDYTLQYTVRFFKYMFDTYPKDEIYSIRNPILDKKTIQFDDPLMEDLKYTGEYIFDKYNFIYGDDYNNSRYYWQNENMRISYNRSTSQDEVVNGVLYAVFNEGDDGKYTFIPVLSKNETVYFERYMNEGKPQTYVASIKSLFRNGTYYIRDRDNWEFTNQNTGRTLSYNEFMNEVERLININVYNISIYAGSSFKPITENDPHVTKYTIGNCYFKQSNSGPFYRIHEMKCDNFPTTYTNRFSTVGANDWSLTYYTFYFMPRGALWDAHQVYNSYSEIDQLKNSTDWSNKFVGMMFLPHILFMGNKAQVKTISYTPINQSKVSRKFLTLDLTPEGNLLSSRNWINQKFDNEPEIKIGNDDMTNWYLMKYHKIKYYNNDIDLSHYYDAESGYFKTKGYFNFTGNGNYVDKVSTKPLTNCIMEYPYQLPSSTNNYNQYVSGVYNTTNTSANIAKQQMQLGLITNIVGSVLGLGLGAATGGIGSILSGGVGLAGNLINNTVSYNNQIKMINAQFADAKNKIGNTINNSLIQDAAWINYYLKDNEQYSGVERFKGDADFNKQINNIIYKYGYYSPRYVSFEQIMNWPLNINSGDAFLQVDERWLRDNLMIYYLRMPNPNPSLNGYNHIYNQLLSGIKFQQFIY